MQEMNKLKLPNTWQADEPCGGYRLYRVYGSQTIENHGKYYLLTYLFIKT
jgi:hypothetical protein